MTVSPQGALGQDDGCNLRTQFAGRNPPDAICRTSEYSGGDAIGRSMNQQTARCIEMGKYFGTDGFRGEANVNLTADHAYKIGRFLGWYYGEQKRRGGDDSPARVVIGKDTRRSSYMYCLLYTSRGMRRRLISFCHGVLSPNLHSRAGCVPSPARPQPGKSTPNLHSRAGCVECSPVCNPHALSPNLHSRAGCV